MGAWVFDGKERFNSSMSELQPLIHIEYEDKKLAFSGFEMWGKGLGAYPIFVHLDNDKREANVFLSLSGGKLQLSLWRHIHAKLEKVGYRVRYLRLEAENGFIFN